MYHHALTLWAAPGSNVLQLIGFNRAQCLNVQLVASLTVVYLHYHL